MLSTSKHLKHKEVRYFAHVHVWFVYGRNLRIPRKEKIILNHLPAGLYFGRACWRGVFAWKCWVISEFEVIVAVLSPRKPWTRTHICIVRIHTHHCLFITCRWRLPRCASRHISYAIYEQNREGARGIPAALLSDNSLNIGSKGLLVRLYFVFLLTNRERSFSGVTFKATNTWWVTLAMTHRMYEIC